MLRFTIAAALVGGTLALPAAAAAQNDDRPVRHGNGHVQAFGGLTLRGINAEPAFGGSIAVPLTGSIQVVAEGGHLANVMSPTLATLLDFTPVDIRLSATYAEAGIRVIAPPYRRLRPYAEATAGFARMKTRFDGIGAQPEAFVNGALRFLDRTDPLLGLGAGVIAHAGPVFLDLGYRFNKIVSGNVVQEALSGGDLAVNQFRIGFGVSF
jgi:hypothetical protein